MYAAIDIGSNTVRLLIGDIDRNGRLAPFLYARHITRLAGGLTEQGGLAPAAMERTLCALREFSRLCRRHDVDKLLAVGTAAFRKACNGALFARQIHAETGFPADIISGEEEARLTAAGVLLALSDQPREALIFDIGGGSTECVHWVDGHIRWSESLPLGVVRLCEQEGGTASIRTLIDQLLEPVRHRFGACRPRDGSVNDGCRPVLVGTAGTVTSLAAMDMKMTRYDWRRVNNYRLATARLERLLQELLRMTPGQREDLPGLEPGRGDLIVPGLQIVLALLDITRSEHLTVSDFGLLEGLILRLAERDAIDPEQPGRD